MYAEDDLLQLSGLQHLVFCERQWALIHLEGIWAENLYTMEGHHLHERVDEAETEVRGDLRIARGLRLRSLRLGLSGRADVVEFHRVPDPTAPAVPLPGAEGRWRPVPVEYKRGRQKTDGSDEVQLCAQALCLEDMLGVPIPEGALYYGKTHRRHDVPFTPQLREQTETLSARLHQLMQQGITPSARYEKKCDTCSLKEICLPRAAGNRKSARTYLSRTLSEIAHEPLESPS